MIPLTVVMRSYNDAPLLPRTLAALKAQEGVAWELIVMESASTDGSPEIFERFGCRHLERLAPGSYRSSRVLNRGVELSPTELVVFLNSDGILGDPHVLRRLAEATLADPRCAGAYARQVARPDAGPMTRLEYHTAFDRRHELTDAAGAMSLVCSLIRKSAWAVERFDERLTYAEDTVWSTRIQAKGWTVVYVPEAGAEHSHEYTWAERHRRQFGDHAALAVLATTPPPADVLRGVVIPWAKRCLRDTWRLTKRGEPWHAWRLPLHHWPLQLGKWHGATAGWAHFQDPATRDQTQPFLKRGEICYTRPGT